MTVARFYLYAIMLFLLVGFNCGAIGASTEQKQIDAERDSVYSKICYSSVCYSDFKSLEIENLADVLKKVGGISIEDCQVTHNNTQVCFIIDGKLYGSAYAGQKWGNYRRLRKSLSDFNEVARFYPLYTIKKIFFVESQYFHFVEDGTRNKDMVLIITNK